MILAWLRANPLGGRLVVKVAVVLPLGLASGLLLTWLCDLFALSQNIAAGAAAAIALIAGLKLANRIAGRLGIPEP